MKLLPSVAILVLVNSSVAIGFESRLEINPEIDLSSLAKKLETSNSDVAAIVQTRSVEGVHSSDASALIRNVKLSKLFQATLEYDRYVEFKMPNLKESHIVERDNNNIYLWAYMNYSGQRSAHYLHSRYFEPFQKPTADAVEWELIAGKDEWAYPDQSLLSRLDGSWYIEQLDNGLIYGRYFLSVEVDTFVPDWIIKLVLHETLTDGVIEVIERLAAAAKTR